MVDFEKNGLEKPAYSNANLAMKPLKLKNYLTIIHARTRPNLYLQKFIQKTSTPVQTVELNLQKKDNFENI